MGRSTGYSTPYLALRSLLPSAISALLCLIFSVCLIGLHLILLSLNIGTSLPTFLDGQWGITYTNNVVQPLEVLLNNLTFNNLLIVGLWGVAGLSLYFLVEYIAYLRGDWRRAEKDVQLVREGVVVPHPALRAFVGTVLWRMGVLVVGAAGFIVIQSTVQHLLSADPSIVLGKLSFQDSLFRLGLEIVGWTLIAHGFVVFLRLFLMRTRLFGGDPKIE